MLSRVFSTLSTVLFCSLYTQLCLILFIYWSLPFLFNKILISVHHWQPEVTVLRVTVMVTVKVVRDHWSDAMILLSPEGSRVSHTSHAYSCCHGLGYSPVLREKRALLQKCQNSFLRQQTSHLGLFEPGLF